MNFIVRGLYNTIKNKGYIRSTFQNWSETGVKAVVMTDGERIIVLEDLGACWSRTHKHDVLIISA